MNNLETLNSKLSIAGQLTFKMAGDGLVVAEIANAHSTASICLQGGHVMTWQPAGASAPVVWLSKLAKLAPGKSIRGGAPVCWPWFGAHAGAAGFPRPWLRPHRPLGSDGDAHAGRRRHRNRPATGGKRRHPRHVAARQPRGNHRHRGQDPSRSP